MRGAGGDEAESVHFSESALVLMLKLDLKQQKLSDNVQVYTDIYRSTAL